MRLKKIIDGLNVKRIINYKNYNIKSVTHISGDVVSSSIFICVRGNNFDGNDYIAEAVSKGAKCIITDKEDVHVDNVCLVFVDDVRVSMSIVAKNFYNRCVDKLKVIGVVGTSGKTTTTLILTQILSNAGKKIGVIGTNGIFIDNIRLDNGFTTPDPLELHYIFYQMKMLGVQIVIMEISAQAIYYHKLHGVMIDICVFTNISREHLDFFGTYENYVKVKMNYFNKSNIKECVVNTDDFFGRELAYKVDVPCVSYGIKEPANSFAIDIEYSLASSSCVVNVLDDVYAVTIPFVGEYNVYNFIAALTVAKMLGIDKGTITLALGSLKVIDGRFNVYNIDNKKIIIDFAHTPDSIDKLLSHIKRYATSKIITVFGCVGYSNKDKRIEMGKSVAKYSDTIIVTTDNRGYTAFNEICDDIIIGLGDREFVCIEDRFAAIEYGVNTLQKEDILVLIGKGAENFQTIGGERVPYSDTESVMKLLGLVNE